MRSLASEVARRGLKISVSDPRALQKVFKWLREIGLEALVEVGPGGIEVPDEVLRLDEPAFFACWLATEIAGTREVTLGVDLGSRNVGLAAVVGGVLAFSGVSRSSRTLLSTVSALVDLGARVRVRIGYSSHLASLAEELSKRLEAAGARVELLGNEQLKECVVLGDFTKLGKLSRHELDALKIALMCNVNPPRSPLQPRNTEESCEGYPQNGEKAPE